ncbi:hypothetical protein HPB49_006810 [Dermacentor silvarum]|uniref:Uncharacterized protein n=1 Tax=Dermacentor silvarum TaxID=543639 RepID=A0ACB8CDJ5_DERSI|nr:hypothetical protein HPB49_006810 [Dermacentor silvarum]
MKTVPVCWVCCLPTAGNASLPRVRRARLGSRPHLSGEMYAVRRRSRHRYERMPGTLHYALHHPATRAAEEAAATGTVDASVQARPDCEQWTEGPVGNARRRCKKHIQIHYQEPKQYKDEKIKFESQDPVTGEERRAQTAKLDTQLETQSLQEGEGEPRWARPLQEVSNTVAQLNMPNGAASSSTGPDTPTRMGTSPTRDTTPDLSLLMGTVDASWQNVGTNLGSDHDVIRITIRGPTPEGKDGHGEDYQLG